MIDKLKQMDEEYEREREYNNRKLALADFIKFFYDNYREKTLRGIMLEWLEKN